MDTNGSPELLVKLNGSAILRLLRSDEPLSRAELSRRLGLSPSTVTRIVQQQLNEGLLIEEESPQTAIGRRPRLLRINYQAGVIMGMHVEATTATVAVADLGGRILREAETTFAAEEDADARLRHVIALINELRESLSGEREIRGIGIGVPSIVNMASGEVVWAPPHGWQSVAFAQVIHETTGLRAFVENDVNLAALGERQFGAGQGVDNLVALLLDAGVGAGIIVNGELHRGGRGAAGEIGYMVVADPAEPSPGRPTRPPLEDLIGSNAIVDRVTAALHRLGRTTLDGSNDGPVTCRSAFKAAQRGDEAAGPVCRSVATHLARAIVNTASVLNPDLVVLGGPVAAGNDHLLAQVREQVATAVPYPPDVRLSDQEEKSVLYGAIALALEQTNNQLEVRESALNSGGRTPNERGRSSQ